MNYLRESTSDGFGLRALGLVLTATVLVAAVALILIQRWEGFPEGTIGYREGEKEVWVNALGQPVDMPQTWHPEDVSQPPRPGLEVGYPSPDGKAVAFVETIRDRHWTVSDLMVKENAQITRVGQIAAGRVSQLLISTKAGARSQGGVPLVVAWSPDGQQLAWGSVTEPPYTLHIAHRDGWDTHSLPLVGGWVGELEWSPDGRFLAISTYAENRTDHTILVHDTHGNQPPRQVAKGCVMVWAPDSRHLALHGEPKSQPGLWVVSVGGHASQITDRTGVAPFAWLPD